MGRYGIDWSNKSTVSDFTQEEIYQIWVETTKIIENENIDIQEKATAYYDRGVVYHQVIECYKNAIEDYTFAIQLEKNPYAAYYNRGKCYTFIREYDKALSDMANALKSDPTEYDAVVNIINRIKRMKAAKEKAKENEFIVIFLMCH